MFRAYKYRLYPTDDQKTAIHQHLGCARWIYNYGLDKKTKAYTIDKVSLSRFDIQADLPKLKAQPQTAFLKEVNSQTLQASLENMDKAFRSFFKQTSGFPKFKSKKDNRQSFQVPASARVNWEQQSLSIPKIKNIPAVFHRRFEGKIKTVTVSKTPTGKYYASLLVEVVQEPKLVQPIKASTTIGIDTGLKTFVVSSEGQAFENAKYLKKSMVRLKVLQTRASRKVKGSNNRKKANLKLARLHEKISNQRLNYIHQVTSKLTTNSEIQTICIEPGGRAHLNVKGMISNHKLAQSLSDVSLGKFYEVLRYKCEWQGINLIQIGRWEASSKACSRCGWHKADLTLKDREYHCNHCRSVMDRDVNAAINIKNFGLLRHSGADSSVVLGEMPEMSGSENQETLAL